MRQYQTRKAKGAVPFEVDGEVFAAKAVLEMQARRDLTTLDFQVEAAFEAIRKSTAERGAALEPGDLEGFKAISDDISAEELRIRAMVVEAACLCIIESDQERFAQAAEVWDDFTLYEIYRDLRKQGLTADEVMERERPTKP